MGTENLNEIDNEDKKENKTILREIIGHVTGLLNNFGSWLKPNPADHWSIQVLKSIGKLPLVLLLIVCSPVLIGILLIVFLIAL